ncbi:MAG TPA: hypothetical protein VMY34_08725, partial [Acidimicrobiales bacterium]|nr:hypothetical protein [Acidimicrobiales bacterium]
RILREQEVRATETLARHRGGLDKVAAALLEHETIDGLEVKRLVDEAHGSPVRGGPAGVPRFGEDVERHGGPAVAGDETVQQPVDATVDLKDADLKGA